jgi:tetratricopeptide (TPR) repeat protein
MDQIERISDRLYEITLSPANKKDEQVINLVDYMQEMTQGVSGWFRLTRILMDVNEYNQVENIYKYMYDQTNENQREERAFLFHELGYVNDLKNDLLTSIANYQQAIDIYLRYLPANHPTLITTYTNLGSVLEKQGDFNGAVNQYQRALKIEKPDEPDIIYQYNNIASALYRQGKFSEAQQTYEKAVQILLKDFPSAHPLFAETYNNMGGMFYSMRDYKKALDYYEKTLEIEEKSLPENHPSLISTCFNLATTYEALKNNKKAVTYAEKAYEKARTAYGSEHLETKQNLDYLEQLRDKTEIVKL